MQLRFTHSFAIFPPILALLACGTTPDGSPFASPSNNGQDAGSDIDTGVVEAAPEAATEDSSDSSFLVDSGFTGDGSLTKDSACAVQTAEAEEVPVDLFLMVDSSGSMGGSPWTSQSTALNTFFTDPLSKGLTIALSFFPVDNSCSSDPQDPSCSGNKYFKPQVNWGELPDHAPALAAAISNKSPNGCTPTQDALNGALRGAYDRQIALKNRVVAAVLVSDGEPCCGMCPIEDATGLGQIAHSYANGTPPINTFAIYVASSASSSMQAIALNGGTQQAYNATGGTASFIAALDAIRTALLACEYLMPVPEEGVVNPELIEVEFTPSDGTMETIPRVKPPEKCGTDPGWHYDDDDDPTRIILCPASCEEVQDDPDARVDILVGCETHQR